MVEEEELLHADSPVMTQTQRTLGLLEACLLDEPLNALMESDIELIESALQKIKERVEEAKKTVLTEEDILGVGRLKMDSVSSFGRSSESPTSDIGTSSKETVMEEEEDELDYEEEINQAVLEDELISQRSPTPQPPTQEKRKPIVWTPSEDENDEIEEVFVIDTKSEKQTVSETGCNRINVSNRDFPKSLTRERQYLKMKKSSCQIDTKSLNLKYPLGVTYDDVSANWYLTDRDNNMVVGISNTNREREKFDVIKDKALLTSPSAITVYRDGSQIAVLCSKSKYQPSICLINVDDKTVHKFCSWQDSIDFKHESRGLARSVGGHLITIDKSTETGVPRLRLFTRTRQKTFELDGAHTPSFLASSGETVVVTDLGRMDVQAVYLMKLNDTDWRNVEFCTLRTISNGGLNLKASEMLNKQYFMYVAGAQIDRTGNIIIADAKNHHFKFFKNTGGFIHRISTDFPVPYVSSFHVNQKGEILILSTREDNKVLFARLTSSDKLEAHIPVATRKRNVRSTFSSRGRGRTLSYRSDSPSSTISSRSHKPWKRKSPKLE